MATPQEQRKIRLKHDYQEMLNIRGTIVQWRPLKGEAPYIEAYELRVNVRTIIGPKPDYRDTHVLKLRLPPDYPISAAPKITMKTSPPPYHPNWWEENGQWCYGEWNISEGLGHHVIRMIRTLQFDPEITNTDSPANSDAEDWYSSNLDREWFPCDLQVLPDPTKEKFKMHTPVKKTFNIIG